MNFSLLKTYWKWLLAAVLPMLIFGFVYPHYIRENTFFWMCLITLPLSVQRSANTKGVAAFWACMILAVLSLFIPTTIGIYMVVCLILVMLLQHVVGSIQLTLLVHILLASPVFTYFNSLVSFPIRLLLSRIVSLLLNSIGMEVQIEGNLVYMNDISFLVDEACAGLAMLGYGLLFGTIILSQLSKNKLIKFHWMMLFYFILLGLILSGNIVRITLLIAFQIMPDHWLHEGVGFCIFAFQMLIPFYLFVRWVLNNKQTKQCDHDFRIDQFPVIKYVLLITLFICLIIRHQSQPQLALDDSSIELAGFTSEKVKDGVTKLKNEDALIYIKPPVAPYRADHNPMICWQGSGYSFKKIDQWTFQDIQVNNAELIKDQDKVYTSWWFQSQNYVTGNQLEWRKYGLLENEAFYLINVTCNSMEELKIHTKNLLHQNIITQNKITLNNEN